MDNSKILRCSNRSKSAVSGCPMRATRSLINMGMFGPKSVTWKTGSELSLLIAGSAEALLQMLHPDVVRVIEKNHRFYLDPKGRIDSTALYAKTTIYGDTKMAEEASLAFKRLHYSLGAKDPVTGRVYRASEPKLLLWVQNTITWMTLRTFDRYGPTLTTLEREQFIEEQKIAAELVGLKREMLPSTFEELDRYIHQMSAQLKLTEDSIHFRDFFLNKPCPKNFNQAVEYLFLNASKRLLLPEHKELYGIRTSWIGDTLIEGCALLLIKILRIFFPPEKLIKLGRESLGNSSFGCPHPSGREPNSNGITDLVHTKDLRCMPSP